MQVCGIQCDLVWEDPAANHARLGPRVREAAAGGARLVLLPELFATGFSMNASAVAEPAGGPTEQFLVAAAADSGAHVGGSVAQAVGPGRPRNVFLLAAPDGAVHRYEKIHPFGYGGEADAYDAGQRLTTIRIDDLRVTLLVCYDLRFPELFALAAERTDLFALVANWPTPREAHWRDLLVARAIETQAYVLGVNRVGSGGGLDYPGHSLLVSPLGERISDPPADPVGGLGGEVTIRGEVSATEVARVRSRLPFLPDRRPDLYRRLRGEG